MRNELKLLFSLSCDGIGCTVVSEPAMNPVPGNGIDLGPLFATQMVKRQFKAGGFLIFQIFSNFAQGGFRVR